MYSSYFAIYLLSTGDTKIHMYFMRDMGTKFIPMLIILAPRNEEMLRFLALIFALPARIGAISINVQTIYEIALACVIDIVCVPFFAHNGDIAKGVGLLGAARRRRGEEGRARDRWMLRRPRQPY